MLYKCIATSIYRGLRPDSLMSILNPPPPPHSLIVDVSERGRRRRRRIEDGRTYLYILSQSSHGSRSLPHITHAAIITSSLLERTNCVRAYSIGLYTLSVCAVCISLHIYRTQQQSNALKPRGGEVRRGRGPLCMLSVVRAGLRSATPSRRNARA